MIENANSKAHIIYSITTTSPLLSADGVSSIL